VTNERGIRSDVIFKTLNETQHRPVIPMFFHVSILRLCHCFILQVINCFPITVKDGGMLMLLKFYFTGLCLMDFVKSDYTRSDVGLNCLPSQP
jgi:archaellum biogenesis protein FlaJ (TadC family)